MKKKQIILQLNSKKISLIALAMSSLFASYANADDNGGNVTLYTRVDAGVNYISNVNDTQPGAKTTSSGSLSNAGIGQQWSTSWWGLKGSEDLGGGLQAIFQLEAGFSVGRGESNGGGVFDRKSFAGLKGSAGTLNLGQDLTINNDLWNEDPMGFQYAGAHTLLDGRAWGGGAHNMVEYISPSWSGLQITTQFDFGEATGNNTDNQAKGFELTYTQPDYELRAIYNDRRDANGQFSSVYGYSKESDILAKFKLGNAWTVLAGYIHESAPSATATSNASDAVGTSVGNATSANEEFIGLRYKINAPMEIVSGYYHTTANANNISGNLFAIGLNYSLSKRTLLYATIDHVSNSANAVFSAEVGGTAANPLPGKSQSGFWSGVVVDF